MRIFLLDADRLARSKSNLKPAYDTLIADADTALKTGPFSVMDKPFVPPSGDKHDYMSVGPYWWPDPEKPDGLPYIRRDGEVNPDRYKYDNVSLHAMIDAAYTLALAYFFSERQDYADHAATLLRTWFLDPATRMNPHLEFAQAIPGICDGRGIGIIDTMQLGEVVDAVGLLEDSAAWTADDQTRMVAWCRDYLNWLRTSDKGIDERGTHNNHGTWYDVQAAALALFTDQADVAREILSASVDKRLAAHIDGDGRQPHELARTRSFNYSVMNLTGLFHLARLGEHVGVDLWTYIGTDGRSLRRALDWLSETDPWPYEQITPIDTTTLVPLLLMGARVYPDGDYGDKIARLDPAIQDRARLVC